MNLIQIRFEVNMNMLVLFGQRFDVCFEGTFSQTRSHMEPGTAININQRTDSIFPKRKNYNLFRMQ